VLAKANTSPVQSSYTEHEPSLDKLMACKSCIAEQIFSRRFKWNNKECTVLEGSVGRKI